MTISPLRQFVLAATMWLPLMFCLWFLLSSVVAFPVVRLVEPLINAIVPDVLASAAQNYSYMVYAYVVEVAGVSGLPAGKLLVEEQNVNVLIYAYSMPLFCGLVAASPLDWKRTFLQWAVGLVILTITCTLGVAFDVLYTIRDGAGNAVRIALETDGYGALANQAGQVANAYMGKQFDAAGLNVNLVALLRQFGYLILPPVVPVVLWILFNREFLESLVGWEEGEDADEPASVLIQGDKK
mgnify:CR=1 FL=1